ncbi:MAG: hypothetical protein M3Z30_07335, partial [Gemmatimonadota bacterium]|nr:hypothetical protein [Gemmatimonadota bacterium]
DKFVQWSKDVAVIPVMPAVVALDARTLLENQYCNTVTPAADTAVAQAGDLDSPLRQLSAGADMALLPSFRAASGDIAMTVVVGADGLPELPTLRVTKGTVSPLDAQAYVASLRFAPPMVHGKPVRALAQVGIMIRVEVRRVQ